METPLRKALLIFCAWRNLLLRGEFEIWEIIRDCLVDVPDEVEKLTNYVMWFSPEVVSTFEMKDFLPLSIDENFMVAWARKANYQGDGWVDEPLFRQYVSENRLLWSKALANMIFDEEWENDPSNTIESRWDDYEPQTMIPWGKKNFLQYHQIHYQVIVSSYLASEISGDSWNYFTTAFMTEGREYEVEEDLSRVPDLFEQEVIRLRKSALAIIPLAKDEMVETDEVVKSPFWCKVVEVNMTKLTYFVLELGLGGEHMEALVRMGALSVR